jgi:hypothetical protein
MWIWSKGEWNMTKKPSANSLGAVIANIVAEAAGLEPSGAADDEDLKNRYRLK